jgi:hypothetical protein
LRLRATTAAYSSAVIRTMPDRKPAAFA